MDFGYIDAVALLSADTIRTSLYEFVVEAWTQEVILLPQRLANLYQSRMNAPICSQRYRYATMLVCHTSRHIITHSRSSLSLLPSLDLFLLCFFLSFDTSTAVTVVSLLSLMGIATADTTIGLFSGRMPLEIAASIASSAGATVSARLTLEASLAILRLKRPEEASGPLLAGRLRDLDGFVEPRRDPMTERIELLRSSDGVGGIELLVGSVGALLLERLPVKLGSSKVILRRLPSGPTDVDDLPRGPSAEFTSSRLVRCEEIGRSDANLPRERGSVEADMRLSSEFGSLSCFSACGGCERAREVASA